MEEKTVYFTMEMDVNEAYLRDTWAAYPKIRWATRLLALLPIAGFLVGGWMWVAQGELTLGFLVVALLFLAFDLALPRLSLRQMLSRYQKFHADGPRRVSLLDDGVETEVVKYGETVFHAYADFDRLEEDEKGWYLVRPGQRVVIPKDPGRDSAPVGAFLAERMAAARAGDCLPEEQENA